MYLWAVILPVCMQWRMKSIFVLWFCQIAANGIRYLILKHTYYFKQKKTMKAYPKRYVCSRVDATIEGELQMKCRSNRFSIPLNGFDGKHLHMVCNMQTRQKKPENISHFIFSVSFQCGNHLTLSSKIKRLMRMRMRMLSRKSGPIIIMIWGQVWDGCLLFTNISIHFWLLIEMLTLNFGIKWEKTSKRFRPICYFKMTILGQTYVDTVTAVTKCVHVLFHGK